MEAQIYPPKSKKNLPHDVNQAFSKIIGAVFPNSIRGVDIGARHHRLSTLGSIPKHIHVGCFKDFLTPSIVDPKIKGPKVPGKGAKQGIHPFRFGQKGIGEIHHHRIHHQQKGNAIPAARSGRKGQHVPVKSSCIGVGVHRIKGRTAVAVSKKPKNRINVSRKLVGKIDSLRSKGGIRRAD